AGQGQGGAHQAQEVAAPLGIVPLGGLHRELAVEPRAELVGAGPLLEALPERAAGRGLTRAAYAQELDGNWFLAHRWQVLQLVRGLILFSATIAGPSASCECGASHFQSGLKTSDCGRT